MTDFKLCKLTRRAAFSFAIGALALAGTTAPSAAFNFDACQVYAAKAVQQQAQNVTHGCGFTGFRWHGWAKGHKNWCKDVPIEWAQAEAQKRAWKLAQCRFGN